MIQSLCANALVLTLLVAATPGTGVTQSLRAVPDLRIDGTMHELAPVGGIAIGGDGTIAVLQDQEHHIRFFDSSGKPSGAFGRSGEGPGEFRQIQRVGPYNGGFWVSDRVLRRITLISSKHEMAGVVPAIPSVRARSGAPGQGQAIAAAPITQALHASRVLVAALLLRRGSPQPAWLGVVPDGATPIVRITEGGEFLGTLGMQASAPECSIAITTATGGFFASVPFCAQPLQYVADDGRFALFITAPIGQSAGARVTLVGELGDTLFSRLLPRSTARIPRRVADSALAQRLEWGKSKGIEKQLRDRLRIPSVFPLFRDAMVGRDGTVWLAEWSAAAEVTWRVLDVNGAPLGLLQLPRNFTLSVAERHQLWGVETDGDGVESVIRYRVR